MGRVNACIFNYLARKYESAMIHDVRDIRSYIKSSTAQSYPAALSISMGVSSDEERDAGGATTDEDEAGGSGKGPAGTKRPSKIGKGAVASMIGPT